MRRTPPDSDPPEPLALSQNNLDHRRVGPREYARRRSLLRDDPDIDVVSMATLAGIAKAIEDEAVRRYTLLAELMEQRGELATAAAFRVMLEEERSHVAVVDRWAASVGEHDVAAEEFEWELPADLSSSWDDVSGSALLSPYRAFALAVENELRAFSFYAYLAAHAENAQVRAEAEKLGGEELRHAALLRRWRRQAYHRECRPARPEQVPVDSVEMLRDVLAQQEAAISAAHKALALRLKRAGDEAAAQLLERSISITAQPPTLPVASRPETPWIATVDGSDAEEPRHLLIDAQKPLEALADMLEGIMATAEGDLFHEAASAMDGVIKRIAQISLRMGRS